jgi:hypothetical protein
MRGHDAMHGTCGPHALMPCHRPRWCRFNEGVGIEDQSDNARTTHELNGRRRLTVPLTATEQLRRTHLACLDRVRSLLLSGSSGFDLYMDPLGSCSVFRAEAPLLSVLPSRTSPNQHRTPVPSQERCNFMSSAHSSLRAYAVTLSTQDR